MEAMTYVSYGVPYAEIKGSHQDPPIGMRVFGVMRVCLFRPFVDSIRLACHSQKDLLELLEAWNRQGTWHYSFPAPSDPHLNMLRRTLNVGTPPPLPVHS